MHIKIYGDSLSAQYVRQLDIELIKQNIPIGEFEKQVGLSSGYISRCRKGKTRLSIDSIARIEKVIGVKILNKVMQ